MSVYLELDALAQQMEKMVRTLPSSQRQRLAEILVRTIQTFPRWELDRAMDQITKKTSV